MAGIVIGIIIGGIVASMGVAMYFYFEYQPDIVQVQAGEPVVVGPVRYVVEFDGTHDGDEETVPGNTFVKIRIVATNISGEETRMSGGQFHITDVNGTKVQPVYGGFSETDLLEYHLEPGEESAWTTQFDVPFGEGSQYSIAIRPTKDQASSDVGMVCILNCPIP